MTRLKVCGMRDSENIRSLLALQPNYMGFIFYEKSPRHVGEELDVELLHSFPSTTKKVGVFVNAHHDLILRSVKKYNLDMVQLHGTETPDVCRRLRSSGLTIIKAFQVDESFNFSRLNNYKQSCDFFLFDTKTENYGGSGQSFNWELLRRYDNEKPFFLSGGIGPGSVEMIRELKGLNLLAIDINSKFEMAPGQKDVQKIKKFITELNQAVQTSLP